MSLPAGVMTPAGSNLGEYYQILYIQSQVLLMMDENIARHMYSWLGIIN